jgi:hypothetical protein
MRGDELLSLLNTKARELGIKAISARALEDWVMEGYFEGPEPKGRKRGLNPDWQYTAEAAERGLAVVQLRAKKTRRAAATRIRLFLLGFDVPLRRIKPDLRSEFHRLLKRHFFRQPWVYEASKNKDPSDPERKKQLRRAGKVDSVLEAAGLKAPDDTILDGGSALVWGIAGAKGLLPTFIGILDDVPFLTEEFKHGLVDDVRPYIEILGLFGNPDEIEGGGLEHLQGCSDDDILSGRFFYRSVFSLFETSVHLSKLWKSEAITALAAALEKTAITVRDSDEWCTFFLAVGAVAAFRRRQNKE